MSRAEALKSQVRRPSRVAPSRVRAVALAVTVLLLLVVELVAVLASGSAARKNSLAIAKESMDRVGDATVESVLRYIAPAERAAAVTGDLLSSNVLTDRSPVLDQLLRAQVRSAPQISAVFVGFSDGSFTLAGREAGGYRIKHVTTVGTRSVNIEHLDGSFNFLSAEHPANDTYDPRTRPWYKLAAASNTTVWTDPYVFFTSRTPGVTAATAVTSSAAVSAVVGVDIELSGLSQFLGDLTIGRTGEAFVVSGNNVVAAPASIELKPVSVSEGSLRLRTIEEIGVPALNAEANERAHIATVDGQRELVVRRPFGNASTSNWSLLVRARESEFTSTVNRQHRTTFRIFVLGGLVVLLGMLLVMWRALRPLATLKVEASTDPLTGLVNRRGLAEQGEQLLGAAGRDGQTVGALAFDLDGFKAINDRLGHHAGDETLRAFAMYLRAVAGDRAIVARLGGDEFAIVRRFTSTEAALVCGETILAGLATGLAGDGKTLAEVRSSAGLALSSRAGYDLTALLDDADRSLTEVKRTAIGTLRLAPARPGAHPAFTATA